MHEYSKEKLDLHYMSQYGYVLHFFSINNASSAMSAYEQIPCLHDVPEGLDGDLNRSHAAPEGVTHRLRIPSRRLRLQWLGPAL